MEDVTPVDRSNSIDGSTPMRLLHYIDVVKLEMGGTVTAVMDMALSFRRSGHHVAILTHEIGTGEKARLEERGVEVLVDGTPRLHGLLGPTALASWRAEIEEADAVHLHGIWSPATLQLARQTKLSGRAAVVTSHGMLSEWAMQQSGLKKRIYWGTFFKRVLRQGVTIHFTAAEEAREGSKWTGDAPAVCIPWLFRADFINPGPRGHLYERFPALPVEKPLLLFLSRLHPGKGLHRLVDALAYVKAADSAFHLAVAGEWASRAYELEIREALHARGLGGDVTFLGFVSGAAKGHLLAHADLFVLPTDHENFGFVVYEALAAGTPAVITTGVNTWRELEAGGGVTVVSTDSAEISAALLTLLADPARRDEMGKRGKAWAHQRFDGDTGVERFIDLYRSIAGR